MKNSIMKPIMVLIILCFAINVTAQTIVFRYDQSGNRIERRILVKELNDSKNTEKAFENGEEDNLCNLDIIISPNPNGGDFTVKIDGYGLDVIPQLKLYSVSGALVYENLNASLINEIDISNQRDGVYILDLLLGDIKKTWKIIKQ